MFKSPEIKVVSKLTQVYNIFLANRIEESLFKVALVTFIKIKCS